MDEKIVMNISQLTDEEVLASIESIESSSEDEERLSFGFSINKTFFVSVTAGKSASVPAKVLDHLVEYSNITIELYHYKDPPPIEDTHMDPIEFDCPMPDGSVKVYKFIFDVRVFPHIGINPSTEEPFRTQPWAKHFQRNSFGQTAMLPVKEVCNIIRYCDKISRLKLFW